MTKEFRADLHCHTTCSDGSMAPQELIGHAVKSGLQAISITDHDTIEAYRTAPAAAEEAELFIVSGVEFSTHHEGESVHLLAYSFDLQAPSIRGLCLRHRERRASRNMAILEKLKQQGIHLTAADIEAEGVSNTMLGRPHIALALLRRGKVSTIKEAFQRYIGDKAPCYVPGKRITTEETLVSIHNANGYGVLAHPHLLPGDNLAERLLELPLNGIEAYYGTFNADQNSRWVKLAERHHLFITGGSDFHGTIKPQVALGCSWTPYETFQMLLERYTINSGKQK